MFDGVDECVPGLVAGGPNDRQWQRPSLIQGVRQTEGIDWDNMPAAGCFVDWEWNWTTNEVTIYWNSSCFYVTSYLNSKNK
jgi:endoglucanase